MQLFGEKYRIESTRLKEFDYGSHGLYFVTICTKDRLHFFGSVETQDLASQGAPKNLAPQNDLTNEAKNIASPNGLRHMETQDIASLRHTPIGVIANEYWNKIPGHFPFVELDEYVVMPNHVHGILFLNKPDYSEWNTGKFGPQKENLGSIIRGYKAAVKKHATLNNIDFAWQPRYYEHIIRSEKDLNNIREYIVRNPEKWEADRNNTENLFM